MRAALVILTLILSTSLSFAQQAGPFSGAFVTGFGQYTSGTSAQRDNGFVYTPPAAPAAPVVPPLPPLLLFPIGFPCFPFAPGVCIPLGPADGTYHLAGGFGGGGVGYNLQFADKFVVGAAGDIGGGYASGSSSFCGTPAHLCGTQLDAVSNVRLRLGYVFANNLLVFAAGGLAVDHLKAYDLLFGSSGSAWRPGYVVGGGLEYKISPHISLAAEYLHTEIAGHRLFDIVPGTPERISLRSDTARLSLNYYLMAPALAPVVARY